MAVVTSHQPATWEYFSLYDMLFILHSSQGIWSQVHFYTVRRTFFLLCTWHIAKKSCNEYCKFCCPFPALRFDNLRIKTLFHSEISRKKLEYVYMFILEVSIGHCIMIHLTSNIIPMKWHSVRKKMVPIWSCLRTSNCELAWLTISSSILNRAQ